MFFLRETGAFNEINNGGGMQAKLFTRTPSSFNIFTTSPDDVINKRGNNAS